MNLNLINSIFYDAKINRFANSFIKELEKSLSSERTEIKSMDNRMITRFRDQFYIERNEILNNYANETNEQGQMYYIYSKNSISEDRYNICICEDGQSNIVIEKNGDELPEGARVGCVLRGSEESFYIDVESTEVIENKVQEMRERILEEQKEYINSKRVEGHTYELYEKDNDTAWLFDITEDDNEGIEEIEFPTDLLEEASEGDLFIYQDGTYNKKQ